MGLGSRSCLGKAGHTLGSPVCLVSYRNVAAAKGFLGLTAHSVLGASLTPAMAKAM